jgi:hypothetical protein
MIPKLDNCFNSFKGVHKIKMDITECCRTKQPFTLILNSKVKLEFSKNIKTLRLWAFVEKKYENTETLTQAIALLKNIETQSFQRRAYGSFNRKMVCSKRDSFQKRKQ